MGMEKSKNDEVEGVVDAVVTAEDEDFFDEKPKKKKKKSKKEKSKKRSRDDAEEKVDASTAEGDDDESNLTKEERKAARAAKKAAKSAKKSALKSQIPELDPDGIPYNKIQMRRMMRRVKNGLDPIVTEHEENEIRRREKRERMEEEALYSEQQKDEDDVEKKEEGAGDDAGEAAAEQNQTEETNAKPAVSYDSADDEEPKKRKKNTNPPSKNTKRAKTVPSDYKCMACNNLCDNFTPHWIYDCPMKKTKKGCNEVAKRLRGLHDPPSQKVFVSGLPFECDEGLVKRFFEESMDKSNTSELLHLKLLKFEDSKRCKGQAFLTFDSDEGAKLALKLNGSIWKDIEEPGTSTKSNDKKKGKKGDVVGEKKQLKLRVTKMMNRHVTKQKGGKAKA